MKRTSRSVLAAVAVVIVLGLVWIMSSEDSYVNTYRAGGFDREQAIELDAEREISRRTSNPISQTRTTGETEEEAAIDLDRDGERTYSDIEYGVEEDRQSHTAEPNADRGTENLPPPANESERRPASVDAEAELETEEKDEEYNEVQ